MLGFSKLIYFKNMLKQASFFYHFIVLHFTNQSRNVCLKVPRFYAIFSLD